jgi:hypothetical protein
MQQCRIIYYSLAALRVSSDTFTHHQEQLNCIYSLWYYTRESLPAGNNPRVCLDIHGSVHQDIMYENDQQDATV